MSIFSYFKRVDGSEKSNPIPEDLNDKDDVVIGSRKKRRCLVIESDDSEDECHKLNVLGTASEDNRNGDSKNKAGDNAKCDHGSDCVTKPLEINNCLKDVLKNHRAAEHEVRDEQVFVHHKLKWLQESDIKDKKGRGITHPNYDSRTLQVPQDYFKKLTPGFQQWWTIKSENFDAVIMFKVGKFYELYHMDAVTGVRELGLVFMKSEFAHCGFPEAGFGRYSDTLIQKGHRVARVEQVETPAMMEQRIKKKGAAAKSDRVVRRELCSVVTKGTRTLDFFNGDTSGNENSFLLAVKEQLIDEGIFKKLYGVCFVDTCVGTFHLGQFKDDHESSNLRTLFAHFPPAHVLCERGGLQAHTKHIIDLVLPSSILDLLVPESEFWSASKTLKSLAEGGYFESQTKWPPILQAMIGGGLGCCADVHSELAVSALGACIWCLKRACIDYSILSLASFEKYEPLIQDEYSNNILSGQRMIIDDVTLSNLDIISPATCTLLQKLDTTVTAFGKRLLRQWVCSPLTSIPEIEARQDAVEQLLKHPELMAEAKEVLRKLPDLERLLRKIHTQGCRAKMKDHPDSRAIFFEHAMYSKRKIADFISVMDGLRMSLKILQLPQQSLKSALLNKILSTDGEFPNLEKELSYFETSFDHTLAKSEGVIIPHKGVNQEYDASQMTVSNILSELDQYLKEQRRKLGCKSVVYWGSGRNRFQLEVPVSVSVMQEYELMSQKKGFRRYRTPVIEAMLKKLSMAEDNRDKSLRDTMENLFHLFDQHFVLWERAVKCLAVLDVLLSLATYSLSAAEQMCRPVFVESGAPVLEIVAGQHPLIMHTKDGAEFIPNDVLIEDHRRCLMITGPNMGGKSTLMRQTGLLVVLAQLGSYIPSEKCKLSPIDRIFTRMGASDRIIAKESTFFVELKETCSILRHATLHSLVLIDELGRGTATYDGAAIASAVVQQLAEAIKCRTLFSTHYHFLVDQSHLSHNVSIQHMACAVHGEDDEHVTFLYKLTNGACPKSYGFNVARLAGLPPIIISSAKERAISCEQEARHVALLRKMMAPSFDINRLRCMATHPGPQELDRTL